MGILIEKGIEVIPMQTGDIRTVVSQSKAGLGTQGPVIQNPGTVIKIPPPTHPDMPDA